MFTATPSTVNHNVVCYLIIMIEKKAFSWQTARSIGSRNVNGCRQICSHGIAATLKVFVFQVKDAACHVSELFRRL